MKVPSVVARVIPAGTTPLIFPGQILLDTTVTSLKATIWCITRCIYKFTFFFT